MKRNKILLSLGVLALIPAITACEKTKESTKTAHVHEYSEPIYIYTADNTKVFAKKSCLAKDGHEIIEKVDVTATVIKEATCTEKGKIKYTSNNFNDADFEVQEKEIEIDALGHNLIHKDAKSPTCTEKGYDAYDYCSVCGYTTYKETNALGHSFQTTYSWADDNSTCTATRICLKNQTETYSETVNTQSRVVSTPTCIANGEVLYYATFVAEYFVPQTKRVTTDSLEHHEVVVPGETPTCSKGGCTDYIYCDKCSTVIQERTDLLPVDHNYIRINAVEATCEHEGETGDLACSFCGVVVEESTAIPLQDHKPVIDEEKLPTCADSHGITEGSHCEYCNKILVRQTEYEKEVPHKIIYTDQVKVTCEKDGCTGGSYCEVCGEVFEEATVIPATGHSFVESGGWEADCIRGGRTNDLACEWCGKVAVEGEFTPPKGHTPVPKAPVHVSHNDPSGDSGTVGGEVCSVCGVITTDPYYYGFERYSYEEDATPTNYGSDAEVVHTVLGRGLRVLNVYFYYATNGSDVNDVAFEIRPYDIPRKNPRAKIGYAVEADKINNSSLSVGDKFKITITLKDGTKATKLVSGENDTCYFDNVKPSDIVSVDLLITIYDCSTDSYNDLTYTFAVYTTLYYSTSS